MTTLHDPITGEELVLYSARGESDDAWRADVESVITCLMPEYGINRDEAIRLLQNSDIDNPVNYRDQIFWVE